MTVHAVSAIQPQAPWPADMLMPSDRGHDAAFRQLRHQTKNALQSILSILAYAPELQGSPATRSLSETLQRRILLTAAMSDVLFGLTRAPGTLLHRLTSLGEGIVGLLGDPDAQIDVSASVSGECPEALADVVLRIAHELVGNAVKHGMHARLIGRISIDLRADPDAVTLLVSDNGWGFGREPKFGEGLSVAALLADRNGGSLSLDRQGEWTVGLARFGV